MDSTITGKVGPRWVEAVIADGVQPLLALDLADGSHLSATPNHLFYVDGGPGIAKPEWLAAGDLQVGDRLRTKDAKGTTVLRVRYHTGYAQVYTLTVAADHDFFVGPDAVLVHNCDVRVRASKHPEHAEYAGKTFRIDGVDLEHIDVPKHLFNEIGLEDPQSIADYIKGLVEEDAPVAPYNSGNIDRGSKYYDVTQDRTIVVIFDTHSGHIKTAWVLPKGQH